MLHLIALLVPCTQHSLGSALSKSVTLLQAVI